jgi:hypothetical protein
VRQLLASFDARRTPRAASRCAFSGPIREGGAKFRPNYRISMIKRRSRHRQVLNLAFRRLQQRIRTIFQRLFCRSDGWLSSFRVRRRRYFPVAAFSNLDAAAFTCAASSCIAFAALAIACSAICHCFCSIASRTAGIAFASYPV